MFLRNLIYGEHNDLKNRYLNINWNKKVDIENKKVDIESLKLSSPMRKNINILFMKLSNIDYFGRTEIIEILKLSPSGASKLIAKLLELKIIIPVLGHGKSKYRFNIKS